jgi:endoglucanase
MADAWRSVSVRRLARGVNLSHWYSQVYREPGYVPNHFGSWMRDTDFDLIAAAGFDHVRFPISLEQLAPAGALDPDFAARTLAEIERLHAVGLAVIVDGHPELEFRRALAEQPAARDQFVALWRDFAGMLAGTPTQRTALELLNEPGLEDAALWNSLAQRAIAAIRDVAPDHSIIVSGDGYSDVAELIRVDVASLPHNIVLNLHHYEPTALTHQSAYFTTDDVRQISDLQYPLDLRNAAQLLAGSAHPGAAARIKDYVRAGWSLGTYRGLFRAAAEFAGSRPLTCNEFGVYKGAPRQTRLDWCADTVTALDEAGIGWTIWDYAGDFAVTSGEPGDREPDAELLARLALGDGARVAAPSGAVRAGNGA